MKVVRPSFLGGLIYLTKETDIVPAALELNVRHNGIVHKHVVLLKVTTEHSPRLDEGRRVKATALPFCFRLLWLVFGFAEKPDVPAALRLHPGALGCDPDEASFFLGRETPVPSLRPHLSVWQQRLYAFMTRNAVAAPDYFLIPSARAVVPVARITAPSQVAWSEARSAIIDDRLAFNPWHGLSAHPPIGSIMRAQNSLLAVRANSRSAQRLLDDRAADSFRSTRRDLRTRMSNAEQRSLD
jgi:hypothetical protein